jgi:hypothetical protein
MEREFQTHNITLLIHIAYGAVLGASFPWIQFDGNLSILDLLLSFIILLFYINSWITNQVVIQEYPYFYNNLRMNIKTIYIEFIRLLLEFASIVAIGFALYALKEGEIDNAVLNIFIYFVINAIWGIVTQKQFNISVTFDSKVIQKFITTIAAITFIFIAYLYTPMITSIVIVSLLLKILLDLVAVSDMLTNK